MNTIPRSDPGNLLYLNAIYDKMVLTISGMRGGNKRDTFKYPGRNF